MHFSLQKNIKLFWKTPIWNKNWRI